MTFRKPDNLVELLQNPPHETFNIEYKEWISLEENEGKAKVVKTCLALRNADGGLLIIGFDNDATPVDCPWEESVQNVYHPDELQQLVSQYADPRFELTVEFPALQGQQYPVIYVPGGICTPVVARKSMSGSDDKVLVRQNAVYVRTLVNGRVGTDEPHNHQDWDRLMEICFENREADFGRVLRRHLEPESLRSAYAELKKILAEETSSHPPTENLLYEGARRYEAAASRCFGTTEDREAKPPKLSNAGHVGFFEAGCVVDPPLSGYDADEKFLKVVMAAHPGLWDWPLWFNPRRLPGFSSSPYVKDGVWELFFRDERFGVEQFWFISPEGRFYVRTVLDEDIPLEQSMRPGSRLSVGWRIRRVLEAFRCCLAFTRGLTSKEDTRLRFQFRWTGLTGRILDWSLSGNIPLRGILPSSSYRAQQDVVQSTACLVISVGHGPIIEAGHHAVAPLTQVFGGQVLDRRVVEQVYQQFWGRV